jgi:glycosyltransferase involved in cell wall biosynthesis
MKIAILTSGILPLPAVQGGAAENLIDLLLDYNARHRLHDITAYSVYHPAVEHHPALDCDVNHYVYIDKNSLWARLCAKFYGYLHRHDYYHYQIEYFFEQAYRQLRKQPFDLIILENRPGYALKLSRRLSTPLVSHIHTDLVNPETAQLSSIVSANKGFICVSSYIRSRILATRLPVQADVVYNGLDADAFCASSASPVSRASLGFAASDFVAVYSGRIVPKKGVLELVQAIQLLSSHADIKLLVVGGDNYADSVSSNSYLDELHRLGQELSGRVVFTGFVPYDKLSAYLSIANVAVVPSRINEALGMTCIEATAIGLPVIATNDGGIAETLEGQRHILIDKDGDLPRQLADALLEVKNHYDRFTGNRLSSQFTKEAYARNFFETIARYGI